MVYTLRFFPSKYSLFHNSNVFGSCIIHILYTGVLKFKKKIRRQKVNLLCRQSTCDSFPTHVRSSPEAKVRVCVPERNKAPRQLNMDGR